MLPLLYYGVRWLMKRRAPTSDGVLEEDISTVIASENAPEPTPEMPLEYDEAALTQRVIDLVVDGRCDGMAIYEIQDAFWENQALPWCKDFLRERSNDIVQALVEWIEGDRDPALFGAVFDSDPLLKAMGQRMHAYDPEWLLERCPFHFGGRNLDDVLRFCRAEDFDKRSQEFAAMIGI